ncbi:MAG: hypothetical protein JXA99_12650 [Candidatus Lokiarchaeota archaeon]|nr:hypothetical protein [Candidatus Lokiarchaeota archaeon]
MVVEYDGSAGFCPLGDNNFTLANADILYDIDTHDYPYTFDLEIYANYTVYNPDDAVNVTFAAPFPQYSSYYENISIIVGNHTIPYCIEDPEAYKDDNIDLYYLTWWDTSFLIFNISLPKNDSIEVKYELISINNPFHGNIQSITYGLFTAHFWNEILHERIEFHVNGTYPNKYKEQLYGYPEINCTIENHENTRSYIWEWYNNNLSPDVMDVFIFYEFYYIHPTYILMWIIGVSGALIFIYLIYYLLKPKKYKR